MSEQLDPDARRGNGLAASSFVPLLDLDPSVSGLVLDALGRARIAAYVEPIIDSTRLRLCVDSVDRSDARTIATSVTRLAGADRNADRPGSSDPLVSTPDPLLGRDTNAEFGQLVADWHVDTVDAIRAAERDLNREDADWRARLVPPAASAADEDEHYVPPSPPPLPRLSGQTVLALLILVASIALLAFGGPLELGQDVTYLLGIGGILLAAGLLVMRLRERPDDDADDGAIL
jgi:hypothetical protein